MNTFLFRHVQHLSNRTCTIIGLFYFVLALPIFGQSGPVYGIRAGLSRSNLHVTHNHLYYWDGIPYQVDYPSAPLVSPTLSLWVRVLDTPWMNLELETAYCLKGGSQTFTVEGTDENHPDGTGTTEKYIYTSTLKYLQLNLNSEWKYAIGGVTPYIVLGPAVSYLLRGENIRIGQDQLKSLLMGYNIGLGLSLRKLGQNALMVEVRYNGDFTPFYDTHAHLGNQVWSFSIGTTL